MKAQQTRSALALVLAAMTPVTIAACGGDDGSKSSSAKSPTTGQAPVQTQPQTQKQTGGAGTTNGAGTKTGSSDKTGTKKQNPAQKGSPSKTVQPQGQTQTPSTKQPKKKRSGAHRVPSWVRKYDYAQARKVCELLGLDEIAQESKAKSLKPDVVARSYAANPAFPANRKAGVAAGCKAGLLRHKK
jgi:hypothetical protein